VTIETHSHGSLCRVLLTVGQRGVIFQKNRRSCGKFTKPADLSDNATVYAYTISLINKVFCDISDCRICNDSVNFISVHLTMLDHATAVCPSVCLSVRHVPAFCSDK